MREKRASQAARVLPPSSVLHVPCSLRFILEDVELADIISAETIIQISDSEFQEMLLMFYEHWTRIQFSDKYKRAKKCFYLFFLFFLVEKRSTLKTPGPSMLV